MTGTSFLVVWLAVMVFVVSVFTLRARTANAAHDILKERDGDVTPVAVLYGGARWPRWGNASIPLIRMTLFPTSIRIEPRLKILNGIRALLWQANYNDLTEVRAIGRISTGIRFRASTSDYWIIFWSMRRDEVVAALEARGVTVDRDPARFNQFRPGG